MIFQVILLIFLFGGAVLGGIAAYRRPLLERIILLLTIPLAWLLAVVVLCGGVLDFAGTMIVDLLATMPDLQGLLAGPAVSSGAAAMINVVVRLLVMVPVFLLLLLLLRIVYAIVMAATGARKKCKLFMPGEKKEVVKNLSISLIGAVGGFAICMLLLLPIHFFSGLLMPTVETFSDEKYSDTYVAAQAELAESELLPLAPQTPCGAIQTYTGLRAAMDATTQQLCQVSVTNQAGQSVSWNTQIALTTLVRDGALGLTLYEYSCNPQKHTLGDFALAAEVVEDIASQEALLTMAQELLVQLSKTPTPADQAEAAEGSPLTDMLGSLAAAYQDADVQLLQSDIRALAELLRVVTTDLADVPMNGIELEALLFDYLADEEATYRVVSALSNIHIYGQVLSTLTEYGMNMLGDLLSISTDRTEHHAQYLLSLQQVLNDRGTGSYELAAVETFIHRVAQAQLRADDPSLEADIPADIRTSYDRYMTRTLALQSVLDAYAADSSGQLYFAGSDGTVYLFDKAANTWTQADGNADLRRGSYLAQQLLDRANRFQEADANAVIDEAVLLDWAGSIANEAAGSTSACAGGCLQLANTILDVNSPDFAKDAIFRQDLVDSLNTDISFGEDENRQFAAIVHTAAQLFTQLTAADGASLDAVMGQFASVGRLLDGFTQFEMTSQVSELLLTALMENSQFGAYFSAESMQELIQNVKDGSTTYEQLFRSVQSLYNILNQINPLAPTV